MNRQIRWGIAGPGGIANKFAVAIKNVECAELCAVASRSRQRGEAFAEKYGIPKVFESYEEMAESDDIDAVYVSTAHPFHKEVAMEFIKRGKHILCEKPLCVNAFQARELIESARKNRVFLMEAMWTRFLPAVREVITLVNEGEIGEVRAVTADFCYSSTPEEEEKLFLNEMAGGSLLDVGIYGLHFASLFLGTEPQSVRAVSDVRDGVDCHTAVNLTYDGGAMATVTSAINLQKPEDAYIYGTKGYIRVPKFYGAEEFYVTTGEDTRCVKAPSIGDGFEEEIYEACRLIGDGKTESEIMPLDETLRIISLMDDIRRKINVKYPWDIAADADRFQKQLDFALEIDKEKSILRQTHITDYKRQENDAEHAWHMAVMIYLMKEYANEDFDSLRAILMALIHDVVEIDAGDTYAYDEVNLATQKEREKKAAERLFGILPDDQREEFTALFEEFEKGDTPEARFARGMDNFQPLILNDSNGGRDWVEHSAVKDRVLQRHLRTRAGSEKIWEYSMELIEANTKKGNIEDNTQKDI